MKNTLAIHKLLQSIINVLITFIISLPFFIIYKFGIEWKIACIIIFFFYNLFFESIFRRCLGMIIFGTYYKTKKTPIQIIVYSILYTLSFSTIFFHIWFPFDILIINIFVFQLPCVMLTKTTIHGFLSGRAETIWRNNIIDKLKTWLETNK